MYNIVTLTTREISFPQKYDAAWSRSYIRHKSKLVRKKTWLVIALQDPTSTILNGYIPSNFDKVKTVKNHISYVGLSKQQDCFWMLDIFSHNNASLSPSSHHPQKLILLLHRTIACVCLRSYNAVLYVCWLTRDNMLSRAGTISTCGIVRVASRCLSPENKRRSFPTPSLLSPVNYTFTRYCDYLQIREFSWTIWRRFLQIRATKYVPIQNSRNYGNSIDSTRNRLTNLRILKSVSGNAVDADV